MACECNTDVTKLACVLQMFLRHDWGNFVEILYEEEGEIEFDSDDENIEEEWTLAQIDVLKHFIHICSNDVKVCITFLISC